MMDKPVAALQQSFLRTKTRDLKDFLKVAELKANSSNNTVFADAKGEVAYAASRSSCRGATIASITPKPVDGSDPATDWGPLHALAELPSTVNPRNGWVQNTNNWPYSAAGANSPKLASLPALHGHRSARIPRGVHAVQLLGGPQELDARWVADGGVRQPPARLRFSCCRA